MMVRALVGIPTLLFSLIVLTSEPIGADAPPVPIASSASATHASPVQVQSSGPATNTVSGAGSGEVGQGTSSPTLQAQAMMRRHIEQFQQVVDEQRVFRRDMLAG